MWNIKQQTKQQPFIHYHKIFFFFFRNKLQQKKQEIGKEKGTKEKDRRSFRQEGMVRHPRPKPILTKKRWKDTSQQDRRNKVVRRFPQRTCLHRLLG